MNRRRSTPWIHRWSRILIAAIASVGALTTGYLTVVKFTQGSAACPTNSCDLVLASDYATVFGLPLALFGFLAYGSMATFALAPLAVDPVQNKDTRTKLENWTWLLLLAGAIAMTVFSGYLMYLLFFKIKSLCIYCLASAIFSTSLLVLTIIGRIWEDIGQIFFTAIVVGMVTLIGTLGVYANVNNPEAANGPTLRPNGDPTQGVGWEITTTSGEAEIQLARHLTKIGAKEYIAWWCPHCHEQKQLFGKEAYQEIKKIECDPQGKDAQPDLCKAAGIQGYPTWEINGQLYPNVQSLEKLAQVSSYQGPRNFKNFPDAFK
ncbi:vitamin K epoxide reductase family protein [Mastigocladopsis repens]|uniref:vitamin K epoxide reductase family protein n=1 Tax=Mastigocladopsis repens TaxID=221287 RepID=UPI0004747828|nr:vitamin K epoxide reductase family protein [Mastigocladopsis repens]